MRFLKTTTVCFAISSFVCQVVVGQYPTTQYQGFPRNVREWKSETSLRETTRSQISEKKQRSMSPNHWGQVESDPETSSERRWTAFDEKQRRTNRSGFDWPSTSVPAVPDLKNRPPTKLAAFSKSTLYPDAPNEQPLSNTAPRLEPPLGATAKRKFPVKWFSESQSRNLDPDRVNFGWPDDSNSIKGPSQNDLQTGRRPAAYPLLDPDAPSSDVPSSRSPTLSQTTSDITDFDFPTLNYRPDLGHRQAAATDRNGNYYDDSCGCDSGDCRMHSSGLKETISAGRFFGSVGALYLVPAFQENAAITTLGPGIGTNTAFDFDYESAPQLRIGFESNDGPGVELNYWQYDESSNPSLFTNNGTATGSLSVWMPGQNSFSTLSASNLGETLSATHTIEVESIGASFFKEIRLPISRFTGSVGVQLLRITQTLNSTLSTGATVLDRLNSRMDLNLFGPRFAMEYRRPIGHTRMEFLASVQGSLLYGHRDLRIENTATGNFNRLDSDSFVAAGQLFTGTQYRKMTGENRSWLVQAGYHYSQWNGGGTAVDSDGNFGLRGFSLSVGYNR